MRKPSGLTLVFDVFYSRFFYFENSLAIFKCFKISSQTAGKLFLTARLEYLKTLIFFFFQICVSFHIPLRVVNPVVL